MRRRRFLQLAALGPALVALPPAGPALAAPGEARLLDDDAWELMLAFAERIVETGEPTAPHPREVAMRETIESVLRRLEPSVTRDLRLALRALDWWPALFEGHLRRFRSLSPEERDRSLDGWQRSRFALRREIFHALRNLALLGYWSQPATWSLIGYGGPWITTG